MTDLCYFNIAPKSPAAKPISDWQVSIEAHKAWVREFVKIHDLGDVGWIGYNRTTVTGFAPKMQKQVMLGHERDAQWVAWLAAHPLWRKVAPRNGTAYAVPRRVTTAAKALAKEWGSRPMPLQAEAITKQITGLDFMDLLREHRMHNAGWRIRKDGSILFVVPYFATQSKNWKPLKGLKRGNQDKLREEWLLEVVVLP